MIKSLLKTFAAAVVMTSAICAGAQADDVLAPSWRGADGSVTYKWSFDDSSTPAIATAADGSQAVANIAVGEFGSGWLDTLSGYGSKTGFWDLGAAGTIDLSLPGASYNDICVQVTYFYDITDIPEITVFGATRIGGSNQVVEHPQTGGNWMVDQSIWRVDPGASFGGINFTSSPFWGADIDEIVIDAMPTVPEPASICALLMGCSAMLIRRRRS